MSTLRTRRSGDPNASVLHLLHRAGQTADDLLTEQLRKHRTTPRQFFVLLAIDGQPGIRQTDLIEVTGIDRSTMAEMLVRLVERGLVQRELDASDRRVGLLTLTETGRAHVRRCRAKAAEAERVLLARLPANRRKGFASALALVTDIAAATGQPPGSGPKIRSRD